MLSQESEEMKHIKTEDSDIDLYCNDDQLTKVFLSKDRNKIGRYSYELFLKNDIKLRDRSVIKIFEDDIEISSHPYHNEHHKGTCRIEPVLCGDGNSRETTYFLLDEVIYDEKGNPTYHRNKDGPLVNMYNMLCQKVGEYCFGPFSYSSLLSLNSEYFLVSTVDVCSWSYISGIVDKNKLLHDQKQNPRTQIMVLADDIRDFDQNNLDSTIQKMSSYLNHRNPNEGRAYNNARYSLYKLKVRMFNETHAFVKHLEDEDSDSDVDSVDSDDPSQKPFEIYTYQSLIEILK